MGISPVLELDVKLGVLILVRYSLLPYGVCPPVQVWPAASRHLRWVGRPVLGPSAAWRGGLGRALVLEVGRPGSHPNSATHELVALDECPILSECLFSFLTWG